MLLSSHFEARVVRQPDCERFWTWTAGLLHRNCHSPTDEKQTREQKLMDRRGEWVRHFGKGSGEFNRIQMEPRVGLSSARPTPVFSRSAPRPVIWPRTRLIFKPPESLFSKLDMSQKLPLSSAAYCPWTDEGLDVLHAQSLGSRGNPSRATSQTELFALSQGLRPACPSHLPHSDFMQKQPCGAWKA